MDDPRAPRLPCHPERRPLRGGGRGAGSAGGGRARAPPPEVRPGGPSRSRTPRCPSDLLAMLIEEVEVPDDERLPERRADRPRWTPKPRRLARPDLGTRTLDAPYSAPAGGRSRHLLGAVRGRRPGAPSLRVLRSVRRGVRIARQPTTLTSSRSSRASTAPERTARRSARSSSASQSGKQVTAVVELQARFDEQTNLERARALEEAGVQVIYGLVRFKTHSKISLVVRREGDRIGRYCHIGSGNYNSTTARTYEDVGLLTADPEVGADVGELFNLLTGSGDPPRIPPPHRFSALDPLGPRRFDPRGDPSAGTRGPHRAQDERAHRPGDHRRALRGLGRRRVAIDLVVRGLCCLRPGVHGLSENIRVRSIVGRFLEHSRIFRFGGSAGRRSCGCRSAHPT